MIIYTSASLSDPEHGKNGAKITLAELLYNYKRNAVEDNNGVVPLFYGSLVREPWIVYFCLPRNDE